ncbi:MAG: ribonuclease P protein component [Elusimicrobia bacterium]|nr:ribonuclease P protein component [Elusimicrobiota bacterium]
MPSRYGFGPSARLSSRRDFKRVFEHGRRIFGRNAVLWFHDSQEQRQVRFGLSVSSKVGAAVRRSRLKRLAREAFRMNRAKLRPGRDIVVQLKPGCGWKAMKDAEDDFLELCRRAGLLEE